MIRAYHIEFLAVNLTIGDKEYRLHSRTVYAASPRKALDILNRDASYRWPKPERINSIPVDYCGNPR